MAAANFSIPPPAKFDLKAGNWDHWIKCYELFEAASERDRGGLSDKVRINQSRRNFVSKLSGEDIQRANVK